MRRALVVTTLLAGSSLWSVFSSAQDNIAPSFDAMSCTFAVRHPSKLAGLADWAWGLLAENGVEDGVLLLRGNRYDLKPLIIDQVLKRRVLAYCTSHQSKSVPAAFAAILNEATAPAANPSSDTGLLLHYL